MCRPPVAAALYQAAPVLATGQGAGALGARQPGPAVSTTGLSSQRLKPQTSVAARRAPSSQCSTACGALYEQALELAREGEFELARRAFQVCGPACLFGFPRG